MKKQLTIYLNDGPLPQENADEKAKRFIQALIGTEIRLELRRHVDVYNVTAKVIWETIRRICVHDSRFRIINLVKALSERKAKEDEDARVYVNDSEGEDETEEVVVQVSTTITVKEKMKRKKLLSK